MTSLPIRSVGLTVLIAASALHAQEPGGWVHIARTTGSVSIRHGDDGPWVAASAAASLIPGDHIATAAKSEADIHLDDANIYNLGSSTEVALHQMDSGVYRMTVIRGSVTCHVA